MGKYTTIDDPSAYFQVKTYTGTNNSNALTNDGNSDLQPDFIWIKRRNYNNGHQLLDSTRGVDKILGSELTSAETTLANRLSSFDTNGFTVESSSGAYNASGEPFVAWQWKANGGTTSSNTAGSTTTTVQVNQDAGFSIVTYLGNGNAANQTLGHGLGVAPDMIISKRRGASTDWLVYHKSLGVGSIIYLNSNVASSTTNPPYKDTPTSTVFSTQYEFQATDNWVSYCFAEKQGYSKFGSYVGNGANSGPFISTGFKPAFIICKRSDSTGGWTINDNKRLGYNPKNEDLFAHLSDAETSDERYDLLSNGFKVRTNNAVNNTSGGTYIYMAFAEHPFVTSTGIPTTAR
jgi:hypothetical protein